MSGLYERIIAQTERLGISGKELGQKLGLKKTPLTDWKNKKSCPTLEQVIKMCEIFGVSSDYLIWGKLENSIMCNNNLESDEIEFLENYRKLDSRGRHLVHTVIYNELDRIEHPEHSTTKIG